MAMEYAREEIAKQFGVAESESDNLQIDKKPPELTFSVNDESDNFAELIASPLPKGMGETLGNAIRRTLLNSLPGSAITWVRIDDVQHEYSSIDGMKEGVIELLLNFKKIRLKAMSERSGRMRLDVKGEGEVVAGDIMTSSEFEIVNPELYLATMDNNDSKLSVEFNVEQGVGYIPADRIAQENLGIGFLPVDSIFSPVKKVNYSVEDYRIGNITNLERLKLEVWTDGSTIPSDAVKSSADILMDKFFQFVNLEEKVTAAETPESSGVSAEIYNTVVESLDLSSRTFNCLKRSNLNRVGDILEFPLGPEMLKLKNFGQKSLDELTEKLAPFMKQFEEDSKS